MGRTLTPRELAANKMLALFGRVKPRDLCDLADLSSAFDMEQVASDAKAKDPGFDRDVLGEMIAMVIARPDVEWPPGADVERVRRFGTALLHRLHDGLSLNGIHIPTASDIDERAPRIGQSHSHGLLASPMSTPLHPCGAWMPRAKKTCARPTGHMGHHRSC